MVRGIAYLFEFLSAIIKIFLLLTFILFLPWLFLWYVKIEQHEPSLAEERAFKLGIEVVSTDFLKKLTSRNDLSYAVGLITNQTGADQNGIKNIDILRKKGLNIQTIFSTQPDFGAALKENNHFNEEIKQKSDIPLISLHGKNCSKNLTKKNLEPLDVLIFDLQDVGIRYSGYAVILLEIMYAAARYDKIIVVLDRPNPLGSCMEGAFSSVTFDHTNNLTPIPLRHGMTMGELARYYNTYILTRPANLHVVPMQQYNRSLSQENLITANLSPNISSINSCYGYSFLGLLGEIAPFDVGIGTDKAFQCIMLPDNLHFTRNKWKVLSKKLQKLGIESIFFHYLSNRRKHGYSGLRLFIRDINTFSAYKTLLTIIDFFKQSDISFSFSPYFDKVIGSSAFRELFMGKANPHQLIDNLNNNTQMFFNKAYNIFLYKPFPQPILI